MKANRWKMRRILLGGGRELGDGGYERWETMKRRGGALAWMKEGGRKGRN
jgi:hypothetical protein